MTYANLSFTRPGWVSFTPPDGGLRERRQLEQPAPFAAWSRAYEAAAGNLDALRALGLAIGAWLDGSQQWLTGLVAKARAPIVLEIEVSTHPDAIEQDVLEAPWELIARVDPRGTPAPAPGDGATSEALPAAVQAVAGTVASPILAQASFLALDPQLMFCPVRRIGPAGAGTTPSAYRPAVVFLAASPEGQRKLDVEREEADIVSAVGGIGLDLHVEDSGTLARLVEVVARLSPIDVLHLSCHGTMGPPPALLLEDDDGRRLDATADDLATKLAGQAPALTFLSACRTAQASAMVTPLAIELCQRGWPAVAGWSAPVSDIGAITFAAELYRLLAQRESLVKSLAYGRYAFARGARGREWHKPRLYLGASTGGKIVDGTQPRRPAPLTDGEYLDSDTLRIPVRDRFTPFGFRRPSQRVLGALRRVDYTGCVVYGGEELDRATFVRRVAMRMPGRREVVVARDFDAIDLIARLKSQVVAAAAHTIIDARAATVSADPAALAVVVRELLEGPCARQDQGAMLLVGFGFEAMLTSGGAIGTSPTVDANHLPVVRALLRAFSGAATESRLLIACASRFVVPDEQGGDLAANLAWECLDLPGQPPTA